MPTVTIDEDVFTAAKDIADSCHQTVDEVITLVSREGLKSMSRQPRPSDTFPTLPVRDTTPVTLEFVNKLREEYGG